MTDREQQRPVNTRLGILCDAEGHCPRCDDTPPVIRISRHTFDNSHADTRNKASKAYRIDHRDRTTVRTPRRLRSSARCDLRQSYHFGPTRRDVSSTATTTSRSAHRTCGGPGPSRPQPGAHAPDAARASGSAGKATRKLDWGTAPSSTSSPSPR